MSFLLQDSKNVSVEYKDIPKLRDCSFKMKLLKKLKIYKKLVLAKKKKINFEVLFFSYKSVFMLEF